MLLASVSAGGHDDKKADHPPPNWDELWKTYGSKTDPITIDKDGFVGAWVAIFKGDRDGMDFDITKPPPKEAAFWIDAAWEVIDQDKSGTIDRKEYDDSINYYLKKDYKQDRRPDRSINFKA